MSVRGGWNGQRLSNGPQLIIDAPLVIGAVSDTHASPSRGVEAIECVSDLFRRFGVGLILHAGDIGHDTVLHRLGQVAPVAAVRGNADPPDLLTELPIQVSIQAGRFSILLIHGDLGKTARAAAKAAVREDLDMVVYGHSHQPSIETVGKTILLNPGSPIERRWNPHFGIGLIAVSDQALEPELIVFDDPRHLANVRP